MYAPQVAAVGMGRRSSSRLSPPRLATRSSENNSCFAKESSHNVTVTRDFWPSFFVTILTHLSPLFICWNIYQVLCAVVHAIHTILDTKAICRHYIHLVGLPKLYKYFLVRCLWNWCPGSRWALSARPGTGCWRPPWRRRTGSAWTFLPTLVRSSRVNIRAPVGSIGY